MSSHYCPHCGNMVEITLQKILPEKGKPPEDEFATSYAEPPDIKRTMTRERKKEKK